MSVSGINNYTNDAYNTNAINNNVVEDTKATQNTSPTTPEKVAPIKPYNNHCPHSAGNMSNVIKIW